MKILSGSIGNLLLPNNLTPPLIANHVNYELEGKTGKYSLCKIGSTKFVSWFITIESNRNDTITLINHSPLVCFQISLLNTCKLKIAGIPGDTLLHEHSFTMYYSPALHVEWEIRKDNTYYLCCILCPMQLLNGTLPKGTPSFLAWKQGKISLSKFPHIADTHMVKLIQELKKDQTENNIYENTRQIITGAIQIIETNANRKYIAVKQKDANNIYKVKKYVDDHITDKLTLSLIASKTKSSKHFIKTYYKATYNTSLHNYIIEKKIEASLPLLLSNRKIEDIAQAIYLNTTTFNRVFKKYYHISPKKYREQSRQKG